MRRFLIPTPVLFALSMLASSASAGDWSADRTRDDFAQPAAAVDNLAGQQTAWAGNYPVAYGNYPGSYGYPVSTYPTSTYPVSTYPVSTYPGNNYPVSTYPVASYPYGNQIGVGGCTTGQCRTCPNSSAGMQYPYSTVNGSNCNGGFCGTSNAYRYPTGGYNPYVYNNNSYNTRPAYRGGLFGLGLLGR